jgi:hypothetical protein
LLLRLVPHRLAITKTRHIKSAYRA